MVSVLHRSRTDDSELARRIAAGDGAAFATLDARHRNALTRYASGLLRRSEHDAEDVVQDVLIRAHQALRAGDGPEDLRPWLYRLTRNRAIDEVRRARWGDEALDNEAAIASDGREDPDTVLRRKETVRRLVEDLADLPVRQRTALLARELDDHSPEQIAALLGVSVTAALTLASRARENLIKMRDARDADCPDVRATLLDAHERGVRPSEHAVRHLKGCDACRAHKRDLRRLSARLHALNPSLGLPLIAGVVKLLGGGSSKVAAGATAAIAIAASGGVIVLESGVFSPGDPAPYQLGRLGGPRTPAPQIRRGNPLPAGATLVSKRVRVPAGAPTAGEQRSVMLSCPSGTKYYTMAFREQNPPALRLNPPPNGPIPGQSTDVRIEMTNAVLPRSYVATIAIVCRRPDAGGSVIPNARQAQAGERPGRVCAREEKVSRSPGAGFQTYAHRGQPVAIQRRDASGKWTRVVLDNGVGGWLRTSALCH